MPIELRIPRKRLINIKNNDQKCFLWCHVNPINPTEEHPGRIKKVDRRLASNLNYDGIEFPVQEKDFSKIEVQNNICIKVFGYEDELVFPIFISAQKFEDSMDLLLIIEDDRHIMCTSKILTHLCFTKQKIKMLNSFVKVLYNVLAIKLL